MKIVYRSLSSNCRRPLAAASLTIALFGVILLGGASVQAQNFTNVNWIASTPEDYSIASGWDLGIVPGSLGLGTTNVLLFTNGVACDYASPDNYWVGQMSLGPWDSSSGSFVMNSGTLLVSNAFNYYAVTIGGRSGTNGIGGNGETPSSPSLGFGSTGSFTMNGGTLTVSRLGSGFYHQDSLVVGLGTNTTGTFTINSGGTLNALCGIEIGFYGNGIFNINGGTVVDNGWFGVGRGNGVPYGTGVFNITAGTLYQLENGGGGTIGGSGGLCLNQGCTNAMVNISGGTVYSGDIAFSGSNVTPKPVDTLNISGGTIYVGSFGIYTNTTTVVPICNISGGTFHTVDMLLSGGKGGANGAITNILADGTNWTWLPQPAVNLTNSSFLVNGSSGPGYVTFAPEPNRTITLDNQWSGVGGMTMSGPGTLAFGAANTINFAGALNVNGGTLLLSAANTFGTPLVLNSGILALAAAQNDTNGLTINGGNIAILSGGSVVDQTLTLPLGSALYFTNTSTITFTNVLAGAGNMVVANSGVVNVGSNIQNTGTIAQNNGVLVVNGTIQNASSITNNGPASVGPFVAQGTITSPIGIGTNSSIETGTTVLPGTLNASNVILNGTWIVKINSATTTGSGVNDLLVCSNLTLNPGSSVLNISPLSPPSVGSYVIAEYSGTLTGTIGTLTNTTRDAMSLSYTTPSGSAPGEIILNVNSSNPANLTWAAPIGASDINWDVTTSSNWTNTATSALNEFHQQDAVTFNLATNGAASITNRVSVTGLVLPSSVNISGGAAYTFSGTGEIGGATGITYNDTNVSGIYTAGNNFTGPVNINAGVLQLGSGGSSWLGTSNTTYVNSGTLDLNGQSVGAGPLVVQGAGSTTTGTNTGAINNSSTTEQSQSGGPLNITLAGNTTFNASGGRWDIGLNTLGAGGGSFVGNGYNLIKIGVQPVWMHEVGNIGVGNIDIQQGELGFQFTIGMGISSDTLTVESGATLGFYQLSSNSILNKQLVFNGPATLSSGGGAGSSNNFIGPITLNGTNSIITSIYPLNLAGAISGTGGFVLSGTGPLYLGGVDTYSGPTVLGAGSRIALEPGASIGNTPLIYLTPSTNTVLDDGAGTITLNSGQTLAGAGSILATNFIAGAGAVISPGTNLAYGTIVFTNNLTFNGGNTNILKIQDTSTPPLSNDLLYVVGNLNLSGVSTLQINPLIALSAGQAYNVIQVQGSINGSASNFKAVSSSPRYTMTAAISGSFVQVTSAGNAANLIWKGYLTPNFDFADSNWFNLGTGNHDTFYNGDDPTFDDSSTVTSVTIITNIVPAGIYMSNVVNTYTFSGGGVIGGGTLNMEGNGNGNGGTLILAMSNAPSFTSIDNSAGTLVYDLTGLTNYTVANIGDNLGAGTATIIFGGTNTALLVGNNANAPFGGTPAFDGTLEVTNGILQYTNVESLGADASVNANPAYAPLIMTNNGTLNFNGVPVGVANAANIGGEKWIHISGAGFNGAGALTDTGNNVEPNGAFCNLYLDGNATINIPTARCDQHVLTTSPGQQVMGNGFNLTFTGGGAFFFNAQSDGDTHFGNIDVASAIPGRLAFQGGPLSLGLTNDYLFVESNAEVTFYAVSNEFDTVHYGINKIMWLKGSAEVDSGGASNNYIGPIFLTGTNLFGTRSDLHLWAGIMDSNTPGGFILGNDSVGASGAGLWLDGTNTYSGATIVSNETLHVGVNSSLGLSSYVQVSSGATIDLSALPAFNFGYPTTNETMSGNGTIIGPTNNPINFNAGGTLAVGLPTTNGLANTNTFALTINNTVVFNPGSTDYIVANKTSASPGTVPVDKVTGLSSLTVGGTLVVTNFGTSFAAGDALPIFSATNITTNSYVVVPGTPGPNLAWNISTIPTDGTLRVTSGSTFNPNPTNIVFSVSGNQLTLSWPADHTGWELQAQTNKLSVGINTNWVPVSGSTSVDTIVIPINLTNGSVFYRLVYPPQ